MKYLFSLAASCLALGAIPSIAAPGSNPERRSAWFEHSLVGMEVGPTGAQFGHSDTNDLRYSSRFDGREIVRRCAAANCEYVVIWARDGDYAYYNSKLVLKCPGLGNRDPLAEAVAEVAELRLVYDATTKMAAGD